MVLVCGLKLSPHSLPTSTNTMALQVLVAPVLYMLCPIPLDNNAKHNDYSTGAMASATMVMELRLFDQQEDGSSVGTDTMDINRNF